MAVHPNPELVWRCESEPSSRAAKREVEVALRSGQSVTIFRFCDFDFQSGKFNFRRVFLLLF